MEPWLGAGINAALILNRSRLQGAGFFVDFARAGSQRGRLIFPCLIKDCKEEEKNGRNANQKLELRLGLPKGRMQAKVIELFKDTGIPISIDDREYRPRIGNGKALVFGSREIMYEAKLLKPQNIVEMLEAGSRDIGFAGEDWVRELGADLVELLDTGLDPVKIVAALPKMWQQPFALTEEILQK